MRHLASTHHFFYDHIDAMEYAYALASHELKRYRVERRESNRFFRFEVVATDIDIVVSPELAA